MGWANSLFIRILPQLVEIIFLYALYISSSSLAQKQNVLSFSFLSSGSIKSTFFPSNKFSYSENINALSRFIILCGLALTIYNNDISYVFMTIMLLLLLYMYIKHYQKKSRKPTEPRTDCRHPTKDNPMSNGLPTNLYDGLGACDVTDPIIKKQMYDKFKDTLFYDVNDRYEMMSTERNFYTNPNTKSQNDQLKFAEWLYGKKNRKMCKTDVSLCTGFENAFGASGGRAGNS